jgi:hypothetical protein
MQIAKARYENPRVIGTESFPAKVCSVIKDLEATESDESEKGDLESRPGFKPRFIPKHSLALPYRFQKHLSVAERADLDRTDV